MSELIYTSKPDTFGDYYAYFYIHVGIPILNAHCNQLNDEICRELIAESGVRPHLIIRHDDNGSFQVKLPSEDRDMFDDKEILAIKLIIEK